MSEIRLHASSIGKVLGPVCLALGLFPCTTPAESNLPDSLDTRYAFTARARALANSPLAAVSGADALYLNPAGLASQPAPEFSALHVNLFESTAYVAIGYCQPFLRGGFGLGWNQVQSLGFVRRDAFNQVLGSFSDSQESLHVAYAQGLGSLQVGLESRIFWQELAGVRGGRWGLDAGLQYPFTRWLSAGVLIQNLASTEFGETHEPGPAQYNLGLGAQFPLWGGSELSFSARIGREDAYGLYGQSWRPEESFALGAEYAFMNTLWLRGGWGGGHASAGIGFQWSGMRLDYAYESEALGGLHWVSLGYRIGEEVGRNRAEEKPRAVLTAYETQKLERKFLSRLSDLNRAGSIPEKERPENFLSAAAIPAGGETPVDPGVERYQHLSAMAYEYGLSRVNLQEIRNVGVNAGEADLEASIRDLTERARAAGLRKDWKKALKLAETIGAISGKKESADSLKREILDSVRPQSGELFRRGAEALYRKQYREAFDLLSLYFELCPEDKLARFYLGRIAEVLEKGAEANYLRGMAEVRKGEWESGSRFFAQTLRVDARHAKALRGLEKIAQARTARAARGPEERRVREWIFSGNLADALKRLRKWMLEGTADAADLALKLEAEKRWAVSREKISEGMVQARRNDWAQAVGRLEESYRLGRTPDTAATLAQFCLMAGVHAYRLDRLSEARGFWKKAQTLAPTDALVRKYLERVEAKERFLKKIGSR